MGKRRDGCLAAEREAIEMREVIDLDDRVGMVVDEKGTATARTARRRKDNLNFSFLA